MATLSSFVTGQSIAASIEKTYIKAPDSVFSSLWLASGPGIAVSTETGAANLPEGSNKSTALKILRASGSDYIRYRFKLDAADGGKVFKIFWNQIYGGNAGDYTLALYSFTDAAYTLNQTLLPVETSSIPAATSSFYTTAAMPAFAVAPYVELRISGLLGTSPLYLSGIIVGPGNLMQGSIITDWQNFTTTLNAGFGGGIATGLRYRREGTDMIISGTFLSGVHTATPGTISLPSGFTIDFAKIAPSNRGKLGRFEVMNSGGAGLISSTDREGVLFSDGSSSSAIYFAIQSGTAAFTQNNPTSIASSSSYFTIDARIPITQWSGSGVTVIGPSANVEYVYNSSTSATTSDTSAFVSGSEGALIGSITASLERRVRFNYPIQNDDIFVVELSEDRIKWQPLYYPFLNAANTQSIQAWSFQNGLEYGMGRFQFINANDVDISFGQYAFASSTYGAAGVSWAAAGGAATYWRVRKAKAVVPVGITPSTGGGGGGGGGSGFIISTKTLNFTAETLNHYLVDTSLSAITATLPAGSASASIKFSDDARTWSTQLFTIQPATGEKIDGLGVNESLVCDVSGSAVQISWDGSKWVLDTNAVGNGVVIATSSQLTEKNYIKKPDNASSDWATSSASLVTFGTETSTGNLPENVTKTTAIRATRVSGTTGYVYTRMVLDSVDATKKLKLQWNQKFAGTTGDYSIQVFSFTASDYATGSTQLSVQTASIPAGNSTFSTTFDAPAAAAPYIELRIVATAGTTPLYLSGVLVGPGFTTQGVAVSEWQSYTPTIAFPTTSQGTLDSASTKIEYRRVGSTMEMRGYIAFSANGSSSSVLELTFPAGLTPQQVTVSGASNRRNLHIGSGAVYRAAALSSFEVWPRIDAAASSSSGQNIFGFVLAVAGTPETYTSLVPTNLTNSGDRIYFRFAVPIVEWSGTVNLVNQSTQSPIRAGTIQAFAGSVTPGGWFDCDGTAKLIADYPQLYAQIGTTWNTCTNTLTGVAYVAPAAGSFRVPDLRGAFVRGAGGPNAAGITTTLGGFQADTTAKNSLANSSSSVSTSTGGPSSDLLNGFVGTRSPLTGTGTIFAVLSDDAFTDYSANCSAGFSNHTHGASGTATAQTITGDPETRPDSVGVRYIIKIWDESFNVAGFAEATHQNLGLSLKNRTQRKLVSSNITSDGAISDWNFSNLTIGKVYRLEITARMVHISSVDNLKQGIVTVTHSGTTLYGPYWNVNAMQTGDQYQHSSATFVATATTISMSWNATNLQLWAPSYASITELNDTENTTAF